MTFSLQDNMRDANSSDWLYNERILAAELYKRSKGYKWLCYECIKEVELIKDKKKKWEERLEENTKKNAENAACKNCASAIPIGN